MHTSKLGHSVAKILQFPCVMKDAEVYLSREHANHRALFERVLNGDYNAFQELRSAMIRHIRLEEEFLFSDALKKPELEEAVRTAWEEHNVLMELLQKIDRKEEGSPSWIAKIRALQRLHEVHVHGEETILFPLLSAFLSELDLAKIEEEMKSVRPQTDPDKILYPEVPGEHQID